MKIFLRDRNPTMAHAWHQLFKDEPDVDVSVGDIFDIKADAVISPSNSLGWMIGGIDAVYAHRWPTIQMRLRTHLAEHHFGELPVGLAAIVPTDDKDIPWLISAPTMRVSSSIRGTVNAYLAFRAVLAAVLRHNVLYQASERMIASILCPGMGTAVGMMDCGVAARQMLAAYKAVIKREALPSDPGRDAENHYRLVGSTSLPPAEATLPKPPPKPVERQEPETTAPVFRAVEEVQEIASEKSQKSEPPKKKGQPARKVTPPKVTKAKVTVRKVAGAVKKVGGGRKQDKKPAKKRR